MITLQLNTYKNVEGGTVGRILSYYDLCDLPYGYNQADKDLDFSEFMTEEEVEEAEGRRQERELEEARRREEEAWLLLEEERRALEQREEERRRQKKIKIREEPSQEKKRPKEPRDASDIFQEINIKRKSSMRPKSAHGNLNNSEPRLIQHMTR